MKNRQSGSNEGFIERIDLKHEEVSYTIGENRKFDDFYFPDGKVVTAQRFSTFSFAEDDVAENIPQIDEIVFCQYCTTKDSFNATIPALILILFLLL